MPRLHFLSPLPLLTVLTCSHRLRPARRWRRRVTRLEPHSDCISEARRRSGAAKRGSEARQRSEAAKRGSEARQRAQGSEVRQRTRGGTRAERLGSVAGFGTRLGGGPNPLGRSWQRTWRPLARDLSRVRLSPRTFTARCGPANRCVRGATASRRLHRHSLLCASHAHSDPAVDPSPRRCRRPRVLPKASQASNPHSTRHALASLT